jgi:hypothetical protein
MALSLFEFGLELYRTRLRNEQPELSDAEIDTVIARWLARRPGAELGDMTGVPSARLTELLSRNQEHLQA